MDTFDLARELEARAPDGAFSGEDIEQFIPVIQAIPKNGIYMEVGVDKGRSLWVARQLADPSVGIYGVDLRPDPKIEGTHFTRQDSVEFAKTWDKPIDVLFIDGDHSYEGCKKDIEAWFPHLVPNGVALFHDCDESSPGVMWATAEYYYKKGGTSYELLKRTDRNTSIAKIVI